MLGGVVVVGAGLLSDGEDDDECDADGDCDGDGLGVAGAETFEVGEGDAECRRVPGADVPGRGATPAPECLPAAFEPNRFDPDCRAWPDERAGPVPAGLPDTELPGATAG